MFSSLSIQTETVVKCQQSGPVLVTTSKLLMSNQVPKLDSNGWKQPQCNPKLQNSEDPKSQERLWSSDSDQMWQGQGHPNIMWCIAAHLISLLSLCSIVFCNVVICCPPICMGLHRPRCEQFWGEHVMWEKRTRNSWFWLILRHPPKNSQNHPGFDYLCLIILCLSMATCGYQWKRNRITKFDWFWLALQEDASWKMTNKMDGRDWLGTGQFDAARIIGARLRSSAQVILRLEIVSKNAGHLSWRHLKFFEVSGNKHLQSSASVLDCSVMIWSTTTIDNTYTAIKPTAGTTNRQRKNIRKH